MRLQWNIALALFILVPLWLPAAAAGLELAIAANFLRHGAQQQTLAGTEKAHASKVPWTLGRVELRLGRTGIPMRRGTRITQPFMSIPATVLLAGAADEMEIQVYVYRSAAARNRDTSQLDPQRIAPPGVSPTWLMPPSLVVDGNLALIVLTRNEELRKKLAAAFDPK